MESPPLRQHFLGVLVVANAVAASSLALLTILRLGWLWTWHRHSYMVNLDLAIGAILLAPVLLWAGIHVVAALRRPSLSDHDTTLACGLGIVGLVVSGVVVAQVDEGWIIVSGVLGTVLAVEMVLGLEAWLRGWAR